MRREFSNKVRAAIVHRAMLPDGKIKCEGCGLVLGEKPHHIDHTIPDALFADKTRELTAKDGKLLGYDCCHKPKTAQDVTDIARAKRREGRHLGISQSRNPMPGSRRSKWKRKVSGEVVLR